MIFTLFYDRYHFSRSSKVHEGKAVYLEFGGNFTPVAKSGDQPKMEFRALRENRLQLEAMVRGAHADAVARCQFMREARRPKGEPAQTPVHHDRCKLLIIFIDHTSYFRFAS
jgi:hypothetical protein